MKAIVVETFGGPDVLRLMKLGEAQPPGPGQVLVEVAAIGVNFMDTGTRRGLAGPTEPPVTPGVEGAGRVLSIGANVTRLKAGDRVVWVFNWGSYAERLIAPEASLVPVPDDIDFQTAAGVMMQGLTASHFATESHPVRPGDTALVHAASGGVGNLLT